MKSSKQDGQNTSAERCVISHLPDEDSSCDVCGAFGAFHIGERLLCLNCYEEAGSCCPEFGRNDLWTRHEEESDEPFGR